MTPNVFGMGTFADGGIFTQLFCILIIFKNENKKGEWCELGWSAEIMNDNLDFFRSNPRLSIIPRALDNG